MHRGAIRVMHTSMEQHGNRNRMRSPAAVFFNTFLNSIQLRAVLCILIFIQLVMKFPALFGAAKFITIFSRVSHPFLSQLTLIHTHKLFV